ncbi:MAG: peptide ABC transporter ATP-binding protein [Devosia sp. 67-54]|uniref:ABC transporter ATP-binding protein n=1 Tax=unclassified Devosia TaxID=196773 RepID=UPI000968407B|nr:MULTISPECIES: oligopeptide/dipeptide ABC transporter ATP-binding protein [unclassified Devosia]MBN9304703.1 ATP-binding cassette domain-containing protein [Devosia sp.]OJX15322.1 MAG: peptide ABC transporter ATP-binding protein [Devosia sp. 67-54]
MAETIPILEGRDLVQHYKVAGNRTVQAVDGVSLTLHEGETLALVGESGCGKSTLSRLMMCLESPTSGQVLLEGKELTALRPAALREHRQRLQMVFQDPYASLDPRMSAVEIVREPLDNYGIGARQDRNEMALSLIRRVALSPDYANRYPHELSGGQRQRLGIARALALRPRVLIADEPVSALDVSIQAQVINLLADIQAEQRLAILFVSHDIGIVAHLSERVAVMYLGRIVESGPTAAVLDNPRHPYAQALLDAVPVHHPRLRRRRTLVAGDLPSPVNPPSGCRFHPRCPLAVERCRSEVPALRSLSGGRQIACHLVSDSNN